MRKAAPQIARGSRSTRSHWSGFRRGPICFSVLGFFPFGMNLHCKGAKQRCQHSAFIAKFQWNCGAKTLSADYSRSGRRGNPEPKRRTSGRMVGTGRFELPTPRTPSECSTRLSHVPTEGNSLPHGREWGSLKFYHCFARQSHVEQAEPRQVVFLQQPLVHVLLAQLVHLRRRHFAAVGRQFAVRMRAHFNDFIVQRRRKQRSE